MNRFKQPKTESTPLVTKPILRFDSILATRPCGIEDDEEYSQWKTIMTPQLPRTDRRAISMQDFRLNDLRPWFEVAKPERS